MPYRRGIVSHGLVLCASDASHEKVDPITPPAGVPNGERVMVPGFDGEAEKEINEAVSGEHAAGRCAGGERGDGEDNVMRGKVARWKSLGNLVPRDRLPRVAEEEDLRYSVGRVHDGRQRHCVLPGCALHHIARQRDEHDPRWRSEIRAPALRLRGTAGG